MKHLPSPNYEPRTEDQSVEFLIIHYTECDLALALKLLTDGNAERRISAHYVIDENGDVYQLVDEANVAWHAGTLSYWAGKERLNRFSIGIELVNPGHGPNYRTFPKAQMDALVTLAQAIMKRHPIQHVLAHSDVAPQRKQDPGELFDWDYLAEQGIGIAPKALAEGTKTDNPIQLLREIGYEIPDPLTDAQLFNVVRAFQMHYYQQAELGTLDDETLRRIAALHKLKFY
jgi:N-acetylmuramoyl-L-alanine amidase